MSCTHPHAAPWTGLQAGGVLGGSRVRREGLAALCAYMAPSWEVCRGDVTGQHERDFRDHGAGGFAAR